MGDRLVPGCIIRSVDMAENADAVDHTARVIDNMIITHLKLRYRACSMYMVNTPRTLRWPRIARAFPSTICSIYVGEDATGALREPTREEYVESFQKRARSGHVGGRDLDMYLKVIEGAKVICQIMRYFVPRVQIDETSSLHRNS